LAPCIQRPIIEPNAETLKLSFMRAHPTRGVLMLVLLSLLLSIRPSAQDQPQRKQVKGPGAFKSFSDFPTKKWLDEDVRWIITDQERADFKALTTDEQRDDFVEALPHRFSACVVGRDARPNPGTRGLTSTTPIIPPSACCSTWQ